VAYKNKAVSKSASYDRKREAIKQQKSGSKKLLFTSAYVSFYVLLECVISSYLRVYFVAVRTIPLQMLHHLRLVHS